LQPNLAQAASLLKALRTPEAVTIPANTLAELRREHGPTSFFKQSKEIETTRAKRFGLRYPASNATLRCGTRPAGGA